MPQITGLMPSDSPRALIYLWFWAFFTLPASRCNILFHPKYSYLVVWIYFYYSSYVYCVVHPKKLRHQADDFEKNRVNISKQCSISLSKKKCVNCRWNNKVKLSMLIQTFSIVKHAWQTSTIYKIPVFTFLPHSNRLYITAIHLWKKELYTYNIMSVLNVIKINDNLSYMYMRGKF